MHGVETSKGNTQEITDKVQVLRLIYNTKQSIKQQDKSERHSLHAAKDS